MGDNAFAGRQPIRLSGVVSHKPPTEDDPFTSELPIELLYPNGEPSGVFIGPIEDFFFIPEPDGGFREQVTTLALAILIIL